jgi:hypothetical protein
MVKILERLAQAVQSSTGKAPLIRARLGAAERALAQLEADQDRLYLADVLNEPGAADALTSWREKVEIQRHEVHRLRAALRAAEAADSAAKRSQDDALHDMAVNSVRQHLHARDRAAVELSAALETAAEAWRTMLERSDKASRVFFGPDHRWPQEALCGLQDLRRLVEGEIYRIGAGSATRNGVARDQALPGAVCHDLRLANQPERVPALVDVLKTATAHTLAVLQGKQPVPLAEPKVAPASERWTEPEAGEPAQSATAEKAPNPFAPPQKVKLL